MPTEIAPHVHHLQIGFVNTYAITTPDDDWVLLDTGIKPGYALVKGLEKQFGRPPLGIVLTHGHFDHAGNAWQLAEEWDVKIYAHPREKPYLTGDEQYPPVDPTVGGALAFMTRFFPWPEYDFSPRLEFIPESGELSFLPGWKAIETPGHTPGHISLWDAETKTILAGDALCTADFDKWPGATIQVPQQLARPATPATPDWESARASVEKLAELEPMHIGAGHGQPMSGGDVAGQLKDLAQNFQEPEHGRYVPQGATYAPDGTLIALPNPVKDPLGLSLKAGAGALLTLGLVSLVRSRRSGREVE